MSQRHLAARSGVAASTISRLTRGRTPSYATALKLAVALREIDPRSEGVFAATYPSGHPTAQVEYALRSDDRLDDTQVASIMESYLALRRVRDVVGLDSDRSVERRRQLITS
jgi:transcriptional regulator with XRE-family HTH domain